MSETRVGQKKDPNQNDSDLLSQSAVDRGAELYNTRAKAIKYHRSHHKARSQTCLVAGCRELAHSKWCVVYMPIYAFICRERTGRVGGQHQDSQSDQEAPQAFATHQIERVLTPTFLD